MCTLIESFVGLMLTAAITGLVFSKMSHPRARVRFSKVAVVHKINGVPHLVVRIANERKTQVCRTLALSRGPSAARVSAPRRIVRETEGGRVGDASQRGHSSRF